MEGRIRYLGKKCSMPDSRSNQLKKSVSYESIKEGGHGTRGKLREKGTNLKCNIK